MEYLQKKRIEVLEKIKPICECFGIEYDYIIENDIEYLVVNGQKIGCCGNSISAIVDEVIGYIFVKTYANHRSLGAFEKQTLNVIKHYWKKEK